MYYIRVIDNWMLDQGMLVDIDDEVKAQQQAIAIVKADASLTKKAEIWVSTCKKVNFVSHGFYVK